MSTAIQQKCHFTFLDFFSLLATGHVLTGLSQVNSGSESLQFHIA